MKTALLIVDLQNDFCPGGTLPTPRGNIIIPVVNKLMDKFDLVIASRDWHPEDSVHFKRWPVHCVRESHGADFPADLKTEKIFQIFEKGTSSKDDGYSAFEATNKNLAEYLRDNNVDELYIAGLTAEYCVKSTVLDAVIKGFKTFVIKDAIEGIRENEGDFDNAIEQMENAGAVILVSADISI